MSVARGFGLNGKSIYSNVTKLMEVNCNFVVDSTNGNGIGIRSLKSNGYIEYVFMHTSTTPGRTNNFLNPNPLAGYALIKMKNNFNYYLGGFSGFVSPASGSAVKIDNSALTTGQPYIITTLGNATLAKWQAIGFLPGFTPAVGSTFVAANNGGAGNTLTSRVMTPAVSGITSVEVVGDPNQMISNSSISTNAGAFIVVQFLSTLVPVATGTAGDAVTNNAGVLNSTGGQDLATTTTPTAPVDGSVVGMNFRFDGSTVTIDGL